MSMTFGEDKHENNNLKLVCESPDEGEPMEVSLNFEFFLISFIKENFFIF